MVNQDTYINYEALALIENEGEDFHVRSFEGPSGTLVMAPHGGSIEPGTSELAKAIACGSRTFYSFEGIKNRGNRDLHITSINFDEPRGLSLASAAMRTLAIHGESSRNEVVYLGGLNKELQANLKNYLDAAGFKTDFHEKLKGENEKNICNHAKRHGVQLELSRGLRMTFFRSLERNGRKETTKKFYEFVEAIRQGLV